LIDKYFDQSISIVFIILKHHVLVSDVREDRIVKYILNIELYFVVNLALLYR